MDTLPGSAPLWLAAGWTVVVVGGATTTAEVQRACRCATILLQRVAGGVVACDLRAVAAPDIATVDALARLRLSAVRLGASLRLCPLSPQLRDLLRWSGLDAALLD